MGAVATVIVAAGTLLFANVAAAAADGTIKLTLYKAGFIGLGATIGLSKAELSGEVYNLKNPSDIAGTYAAGQASAALIGGGKVAELKNSNGVVLKVKGAQVGVELALDLSGMQISLKN